MKPLSNEHLVECSRRFGDVYGAETRVSSSYARALDRATVPAARSEDWETGLRLWHDANASVAPPRNEFERRSLELARSSSLWNLASGCRRWDQALLHSTRMVRWSEVLFLTRPAPQRLVWSLGLAQKLAGGWFPDLALAGPRPARSSGTILADAKAEHDGDVPGGHPTLEMLRSDDWDILAVRDSLERLLLGNDSQDDRAGFCYKVLSLVLAGHCVLAAAVDTADQSDVVIGYVREWRFGVTAARLETLLSFEQEEPPAGEVDFDTVRDAARGYLEQVGRLHSGIAGFDKDAVVGALGSIKSCARVLSALDRS